LARARKPLGQLSPAYRRRIERENERAAAEGREPNRQRARGKRAGEHIERQRKETALGGLTSQQRYQIRKFISKQADLNPLVDERERKAAENSVIQWAMINGYDRWREARDNLHARRQAYQRHTAKAWKTYYHEGWIPDQFEHYEMDFPEADWLFWYH
jgi:hypothetical protein